MFSTFKYDPETREVQELRSAFDPITARSSQHQACNNCHAKKLKCSGEKSGCERCATNKIACEYTRSNSRSSRRGRKPSGRSSNDSRRDSGEYNGGDSSPGSQSGSKPLRRQAQGQRVRQAKRAAKSVSLSPRPNYEDFGALGQLDPSLLSPDDAFDMRSVSLGSESDILATSVPDFGLGMPAYATASPDFFQHHIASSWPMTTQSHFITTSSIVDPSFMSTVGPETYPDQEFFTNFPDYTQYSEPQPHVHLHGHTQSPPYPSPHQEGNGFWQE